MRDGVRKGRPIMLKNRWIVVKNPWILLTTCCLTLIGGRNTPALAQGVDLRLGWGYDSNVFEVNPTAASAPVQAYYSRLAIAYAHKSRTRGLSFSLKPRGYVTWYPQAISGNQYGAQALLGFKYAWRNPRRRARWFRKTTTHFDVSAGYERAIYLKRETREEFGIGAVDQAIPITELPGRGSAQAELRIHSSVTKTVTVDAGATSALTDYSNATNASLPSFNRLDSREFGAFLKASVDVVRGWAVSGRASWRDRVYPNRDARTAAGLPLPDPNRRFWYWDLEGAARFRAAAVRNRATFSYRHRADRFEGYYSYNQWEVGDRVTVSLAPEFDLTLRYSYGRKRYDLFAPSGSPILNSYHDGRAALAADLAKAWQLTLGWDYERTASNDPVLDYSRMKLFAQIRTRR